MSETSVCKGYGDEDCRCLVKDGEPPLRKGDVVEFEGERMTIVGFRAHGRLLELRRTHVMQLLCVPRAPFGVPITALATAPSGCPSCHPQDRECNDPFHRRATAPSRANRHEWVAGRCTRCGVRWDERGDDVSDSGIDRDFVILPTDAFFEFLGEMALPPWVDEQGVTIGSGIDCAPIAARLVAWVKEHDLSGVHLGRVTEAGEG